MDHGLAQWDTDRRLLAPGWLRFGGKGPPALDDVMPSYAEEDLPITALLNVSHSCLASTVFSCPLGGPEHRD